LRLLVTGGAGFIGSNFIRYMLSKYREIEISNLDSLSYSGRLENLLDVRNDKRYTFIHGNIQDKKIVEEILRKDIDVLVNFAAETHVDRSVKEADPFVLTDVYGTYVLMEATRKYDVKKIVQISTDEVYGSIKKGSFDESAPLNPSSPYAASKASGDLIAQSFYKTYNLNVTTTRSSNNFGPYQYPEKLIPKFILRALQNQPLPLYGTGKQTRDWIYVFDNCEALDLIIEKGKPGEIYNIAAGNEYSNLEITRLILRITERPEKLIRFVADRPGHDSRYSLDITKVKRLKWKTKNEFDKSLKETVEWYEKNEWWWRPLLKDDFVSRDTPWL
jgi:dTDP-glucose 4,6-dehydratase